MSTTGSSSPPPQPQRRDSPSQQASLMAGGLLRDDSNNTSTSGTPNLGHIAITGDNNARPSSSSFSSSAPHREPIRSFIHGSVRDISAPMDSAHNARSVRQDTAELASYVLSARQGSPFRFQQRGRAYSLLSQDAVAIESDSDAEAENPLGDHPSSCNNDDVPSVILETSEPPSPPEDIEAAEGPSLLASMLRRSPLATTAATTTTTTTTTTANENPLRLSDEPDRAASGHHHRPVVPQGTMNGRAPPIARSMATDQTESTPLLQDRRPSRHQNWAASGSERDVEGQKIVRAGVRPVTGRAQKLRLRLQSGLGQATRWAVFKKQNWSRAAVWRNAVVAPASCLPAVVVGLLLNILDALSYGMILFPLGKPIFAGLGSAGISIFYVSTIISQLTFSSGSIFKGGIGSELIEVVPFFHNMAETITQSVGEDQPDAVIATTIVSYAASSMMTGLVFYLMGKFHFGYIVGFIPRHILIGCIGGVGWFLVATGFEVSARLDGSLEYDLDTLHKLMRPDTWPLWMFPLVLATALFWGQSKVSSKYFLPLYILCIPLVFYFFVTAIDVLDPDTLRDKGWIFDGPPSGEPWWYFYTLYQFHLVRWDAVIQTIPAMLALTFFGILHVPINVPALALNCGEDNADLDVELKLHGYSNFLSGLAGSIQNYLVYANTVFFMRSGGDSRLAGFMLAGLTFLVMLTGPSVVGFIPVMMVGTLIFDLGFELLLEAVWLSRKKLKMADYLTVIVIVLVMGIYDFVIGIGIGILLAFVALIVQASRVSPVRGSYTGDIVTSTVRRNPSQHGYLQRAGKQIYIIKLTGYLFFGTIVSVESKIRALIADHAFKKQPIRYLILDMWHVSGLDYSAGEAFNTINRLLGKKGIVLVFSGVDAESQLGRNLRTVGLGEDGNKVILLPDLNSALESCENELLKTLYASQEALDHHTSHQRSYGLGLGPGQAASPATTLDVPPRLSNPLALDSVARSPRQSHLHEAAKQTLTRWTTDTPPAWQNFGEPLRLMLQIFHGLSGRNEDFWFPASSYFCRRWCRPGETLFRRGEPALGFYLVEKGILRAEYDLPQGRLWESIVAGTTCGELPFFSETNRTATVIVDRAGSDKNAAGDECVLWLLDKTSWERLRLDHPEVAQELLTVSLKLTSERMSSITSYILAVAG